MRKWIAVVALSCFSANFAQASVESPLVPCDSQARDKNLPAEVRNKVARSCGKVHERINNHLACVKQADNRKLLGNEKRIFMQKCTGQAAAGRK